MFKKLFQKDNIAGLDLGSSYVKWVEIDGDNIADMRLKNYAVEPIPKELMPENGNFKDSDFEAVADIVSKCWKKSGSSNKNVAVALPPGQVIVKKFSLQKAETESEMLEVVQQALSLNLPEGISVSDVSFDYSIIKDNEANSQEYDVIVVAVKKEILDSRLAIIEMAGLNPIIMDTEQFAMQNMARFIRGVNFLSNVSILIDCSGSMLKMWAFKKGELVYSKDVEIGGVHMTHEIANNLGINFEEAESKKFNRNEYEEGFDTYDMVEKAFLKNYVTEIIRAFAYFSSATSVNEVDEIILCGGVAGIPGLTELLEESLIENSDVLIKTKPYVARPLSQKLKESDENSKINLTQFIQVEAGLFLATSLALRKFLRHY